MKNIICSLLIGLSMLSACQKRSTITNVPLDPAFKAAFNFLPGSYWIYKDSIIGQIDSVFVRWSEDHFNSSNVQGYYGPSNAPEGINTYLSEYNLYPGIQDTGTWQFNP